MKRLTSKLTAAWCRVFHPAPMWPVNGQYRCPVCLRSYRVPWEDSVSYPVPTAHPAGGKVVTMPQPAHAVERPRQTAVLAAAAGSR